MIKPSDLVRYGDFEKFIFYGKDKLPNTTLKTRFGDFDLGAIDWERVKRIQICGGDYYYDYGFALCQVIIKPNANIIAYVLDKLGEVRFFQSENDKLLYVLMEAKK